MEEMGALLVRWRLDEAEVRRRMYRAPTPRERERWHAVWLLAQGWTAAAVGRALERDAHTIGQWAKAFAEGGPRALVFEQTGGSPALDVEQRGELKSAVQGSPLRAGINLSNWNWRSVRRFVEDRFGLALSRSSCLNYLHRLGFVLKRPKKRLLKAYPARRAAFVGEYAALTAAVRRTGAKVFFADEAHFQADADLRGKWVLRGEPALVDSTSPRRGEKVSYYSAVCLETGEVAVMELEGNSNAATSTAFLRQLRAQHREPLIVIWDNPPARDWSKIWRCFPGLSHHTRPEPALGELAQLQSGLQSRRGHLGLGTSGSNGQPVSGNPCRRAGKGGRLFHRTDPATGRSQTPLPNRAARKSR